MRFVLPALIALLPCGVQAQSQAGPQSPPLSLEHRMLLRCSAAFALVAARQDAGLAEAQAYPALGVRGREFFVRASARVMDEAGLDRAAVAAALTAEARDLAGGDDMAQVMPVCLGLLGPE